MQIEDWVHEEIWGDKPNPTLVIGSPIATLPLPDDPSSDCECGFDGMARDVSALVNRHQNLAHHH